MLPSFAANDLMNSSLAYAKLLPSLALAHSACNEGSNFANVTLGQLGISIVFTFWGKIARVASFRKTILHIFFLGAEKKVGRIATRRVVACVANLYACWDWAVDQRPSHAMRFLLSATNPPIACGVVSASPYPAIPLWALSGRSINFGPEGVWIINAARSVVVVLNKFRNAALDICVKGLTAATIAIANNLAFRIHGQHLQAGVR